MTTSRSLLSLALGVGLAAFTGSARAETVHTVARGQTLGVIAKRYRISVDTIRQVNHLRPGQLIHPGVSLVIPDKGKEAEAIKKALAKDDLKKSDRRERDKKAKSSDEGKRPKGPVAKLIRRPGLVHFSRGTERLDVQLLARGRVSPQALAKLKHMLRAKSGAESAIDPRLAALIVKVSDHFGGRMVRVVSGFRPYSPSQYTPHSNHNHGRAMDFSIEGVKNTELRDFCRTLPNAGVGYYPNSSFVHLDVRSAKTYWVDYSRAGEPPRYEGQQAPKDADEAAGDVDVPSYDVDP